AVVDDHQPGTELGHRLQGGFAGCRLTDQREPVCGSYQITQRGAKRLLIVDDKYRDRAVLPRSRIALSPLAGRRRLVLRLACGRQHRGHLAVPSAVGTLTFEHWFIAALRRLPAAVSPGR